MIDKVLKQASSGQLPLQALPIENEPHLVGLRDATGNLVFQNTWQPQAS